MSPIDWGQVGTVLLSSGVLAQGLAMARWVLRVEVRLAALERRR